MSNTDSKLRVFLSYAQEDFEIVHKIYNRLKGEGWIEPWQDKPEIDLGETWAIAIKRAINSADAVVVFLSENSINKEGFVHYEMRYAWQLSLQKPPGVIFLIPIRLDNCDVPVDFYELDSKQWGDYFNGKENETYEKLLKALRHRLEQIKNYKSKKQDSFDKISKEQQAEEQTIKDKEEQERKKADEQAKRAAEEEAHKAKAERDRIAREKAEERKKAWIKALRKINFRSIFKTVGGIAVALSLLFVGKFIIDNPPKTPTPSATVTKTATITLQTPTKTPVPSPTNTRRPPTITPTPTLGIGSSVISTKDGMTMMYVPAGEFTMGKNTDNPHFGINPAHQVYLDAFYIDQTEVTNIMYSKCVLDGACKSPLSKDTSYYNNSRFADYPVVNIDWSMAKTYCQWRNSELPTEAQWEKSVRGTDGRIYPWGDLMDVLNANFTGNTTKVGSYKRGVSPYGLYDMAGNVEEWVNDWYSLYYYYKEQDYSNPMGPSQGDNRVIRDSSSRYYAESFMRGNSLPIKYNSLLGFRCAKSAS